MIVGLIMWLYGASTAALAANYGTVWSDDFSGSGREESLRHVERVKEGGVTISGQEQVWALPSQTPFSAGVFSGSIVVEGTAAEKETVRLWRKVLVPGRDFEIACPEGGPGSSRTHRVGGVFFPLGADGVVAGWGPAVLRPQCPPEQGSTAGNAGSRARPVVLARTGKAEQVAPGATYGFSFLVMSGAGEGRNPVMSVQVLGASGENLYAEETLRGRDFAGGSAPDFENMTKRTLTVNIPASVNEASLGFRVISHASPASCFMMGPVYLAAQDGLYTAPVFDSLSSLTSWRRIEYSFDQNQSVHAPDCSCSPGSPVTPAVLRYGLSDSPDVRAERETGLSREEIGVERVPETAAGRYMAISVLLFGRAKAGLADESLAPADSREYFSGLTPVIRFIRVSYFARAAEVKSPLIFPSSIRKWSKIAYRAETPSGTRVIVDVLSGDGGLIAGDIPADFTPGVEMDVFKHQAIRLRARLYDDPNDRKNRPVLKKWGVSWEKETGRLSIRPSAFNPGKGEFVEGLVYNPGGGRIVIRVYNREGRLIRNLLSEDSRRGSLAFSWDGMRNDGSWAERGEYFITSTSIQGAATRKVRVER